MTAGCKCCLEDAKKSPVGWCESCSLPGQLPSVDTFDLVLYLHAFWQVIPEKSAILGETEAAKYKVVGSVRQGTILLSNASSRHSHTATM